jgi:hypothetical protein
MLSNEGSFSREFHSHLTKSFWLESDCKQSTDFKKEERNDLSQWRQILFEIGSGWGCAPTPPHRDQLYSCVMGRSISRLAKYLEKMFSCGYSKLYY